MGKGLKGGEDSLRVGDQEELTQGRQRACPAVCSRAMSGSPGVGKGPLDPVTPMSCLSQSPGRPVDRPEVSERESGQWKTEKPESPLPPDGLLLSHPALSMGSSCTLFDIQCSGHRNTSPLYEDCSISVLWMYFNLFNQPHVEEFLDCYHFFFFAT